MAETFCGYFLVIPPKAAEVYGFTEAEIVAANAHPTGLVGFMGNVRFHLSRPVLALTTE